MRARYRLVRRRHRGGRFYCQDTANGQRTSLGTADKTEVLQIVQPKARRCVNPP